MFPISHFLTISNCTSRARLVNAFHVHKFLLDVKSSQLAATLFKIKVNSFLGFLCRWIRMKLRIRNICYRLRISVLVFIHAFIYNFLADGIVVAFVKRIWVDILLKTKILFFNHFSRKRNVFEFFDVSSSVLSVKKSRRLKFLTLNINIFHLML